ncbi:hypothetical protein TUN199_11771 [Pyrenophora tritici-repentis]|nr:hypothetical protein TUN205_11778 [Pyrenophora tritici-repentis]KAI0616238.1 hypothetical protein TUN199_11771 [Pyrenophora tritici-repentis]
MSYMLWSSYFGSFLQVVKGLSIQNASYVSQSYTVIGVLVAVSVGYLIHQTGRFKYVATFILVCQIFIAIAQGVIVICDEIAILATVSHEHVAVCLAVLGIFANTGGAIGLTIASAIWQDILPKKLMEYLPPEELPNFLMIYGDISTQLSYPMGSPTRLAIQHAYADALLRLLAASTGVWVIGAVGVLMWRNINVKDIKQTKGNIW